MFENVDKFYAALKSPNGHQQGVVTQAETSAESTFKVGDRVVLFGLKVEELNGARIRIDKILETEGKCEVVLLDDVGVVGSDCYFEIVD